MLSREWNSGKAFYDDGKKKRKIFIIMAWLE
jgi:hypothetical protein